MKKNLLILYGGKSAEHEVSLTTATTVINAVDKAKYNIFPVYITKQGTWRSCGQLRGDACQLQFDGESEDIAQSLGDILLRYFSTTEKTVVFPVIHGPNGEDGTLQGLLELLNVPYVGNGVQASAIGIDKVTTKELFTTAGLPQCDYVAFKHHEWEADEEAVEVRIEQTIGYPCYVKPAQMGSSVGINWCADRAALRRAIREAFLYDRKIVVEQEVVGREVQVAVIGNDHPISSIAGEFVKEKAFFDYGTKYGQGKLFKQIPANITEDTHRAVRELAVKAFQTINGSGLMRVDFFVTDAGDIFLNEVNTLPGCTAFSMFPVLWEQTNGTTYPQLIDRLIELALERHAQKQQICHTRVTV